MHSPIGWHRVTTLRRGVRSRPGRRSPQSLTVNWAEEGAAHRFLIVFPWTMPIFFFNSLRNQWAGTDGKWEAAKGKKMVLERSAEPGAPLQVHPPRSRWHGLHWLLPPGTTASSAPPICCQDQMTILISSSARSACKSGATAHCTTYKVFCKHNTYWKEQHALKEPANVPPYIKCKPYLGECSFLYATDFKAVLSQWVVSGKLEWLGKVEAALFWAVCFQSWGWIRPLSSFYVCELALY